LTPAAATIEVLTADGAHDQLSCGLGTDTLQRDVSDIGGEWSCEAVTPPFVLPPVVGLPAVVTVLPGTGGLAVAISCDPVLMHGCQGALEVLPAPGTGPVKARVAAKSRIARGAYRLRPGERRTVRMRMTAAGRRHLRRHRRPRVTLHATNVVAPPSVSALRNRTARVRRALPR
jgi:hypothetical protein